MGPREAELTRAVYRVAEKEVVRRLLTHLITEFVKVSGSEQCISYCHRLMETFEAEVNADMTPLELELEHALLLNDARGSGD